MKKRILITAHSLEIGGIERSLVGLLEVLDYSRVDVDVLLYARKGELLEYLTPQCTVLPQIPQCASMLEPIKAVLTKGHILLGAARIFARTYVGQKYKSNGDPERADGIVFAQLQKYWDASIPFMPKLKGEYDLAISFMWPHHYVAQKVRAKKKIAWIHTDYTIAVMDFRRDARIWSSFDRIAAVSDECGEAFLKVYPQFRDRMVTIENVLPMSFVQRSAVEFEPQDLQGPPGGRLLSVGRLCYAKGYDRAAKAARILKDRGVPFCWTIIGFGTEEEKLRAIIHQLGVEDCFVLLGKRSNPYPYIRACDLFLQPSRYEGKAVSVREAQMLAKPVLITDFQTARSQVRDGFDAVVVPQEETAIADAIEALLNDAEKRASLSQNTKTTDYSNAAEAEKIMRLMEI